MADTAHPYTVLFQPWFDEQRELETPAKGYLPDVDVLFDSGARYRLFFIDPVRLGQDAETTFETGWKCFTEPGLVVVPEVTRANVLAAVGELVADKFFETLRPVPAEGGAARGSRS
jgi:hypothetical protein